MFKALILTALSFVSSFSEHARITQPASNIKRVVAIALDGIPEKEAITPMTPVVERMRALGYQVHWFGTAQQCVVSQPFNLSLPAYSTVFSGKHDRRIRNNWWNGRVRNQTLFDRFPSAQLFSSWRPIRNVMAATHRAFRYFMHFGKGIGSDDLVMDGFLRQYNGSKFTFVHFVDADDFAHMQMHGSYKTLIKQESEKSLQIMEHVHQKNGPDTMFVIFTDHSRGEGKLWHSHGTGIPGSDKIWIMIVTPVAIEISMPQCNHTAMHDFILGILR